MDTKNGVSSENDNYLKSENKESNLVPVAIKQELVETTQIKNNQSEKIYSQEKKIGTFIYLKRCKLRISQEELANLANKIDKSGYLTQQRISCIEKGSSKPYFVEICAIAYALNINLDEFRSL